MTMEILFTLFSTILLLKLQGMEACTCFPTHPQVHFCSSQFAIKGKVTDGRTVPFVEDEPFDVTKYRHFTVDVLKIYKADSNVESMLEVGKSALIISAGSGGMCGVWLETNDTYILFGTLDKTRNKLRIGDCNWLELDSKITDSQRKGIEGAYDCSCKINEPEVATKDRCMMKPREMKYPHHFCYFWQGICSKGTSEVCTWDISKEDVPPECIGPRTVVMTPIQIPEERLPGQYKQLVLPKVRGYNVKINDQPLAFHLLPNTHRRCCQPEVTHGIATDQYQHLQIYEDGNTGVVYVVPDLLPDHLIVMIECDFK